MKLMSKLLVSFIMILTLGLFVGVSNSNASFMSGNTMTTAYYYPDNVTVFGTGVDTVVGAGVEITASVGLADIDYSNDKILVTFLSTGAMVNETGDTFNGWRFYDNSDNVTDFASASLAYLGGGLSGWSLSWDADNIWLNGVSGTLVNGSSIEITLTAVPKIPEPSTLLLLGSGLVGLGFIRRRFRK